MSTAALVRAVSITAVAASLAACSGGRFSGSSNSLTTATTTATTVSGTPDVVITISAATPAPSPSASPGTGTGTTPGTGTQATTTPAASYSPDTARILIGQTVAWRNEDSVPHSATQIDGRWDTGLIAPGATSQPIKMPVGEYLYTDTALPAGTGTGTGATGNASAPVVVGKVISVP